MADPTVLLLNGPNLGLLGLREPEIYGDASLDDHVASAAAVAAARSLALEHHQSDAEADIVRAVHGARGSAAGIIINPGALSHYAWSLHDALSMFDGPIIELHLSNTARRESWRHTSVVTPVATGLISGLGAAGYPLAVTAMADLLGRP